MEDPLELRQIGRAGQITLGIQGPFVPLLYCRTMLGGILPSLGSQGIHTKSCNQRFGFLLGDPRLMASCVRFPLIPSSLAIKGLLSWYRALFKEPKTSKSIKGPTGRPRFGLRASRVSLSGLGFRVDFLSALPSKDEASIAG